MNGRGEEPRSLAGALDAVLRRLRIAPASAFEVAAAVWIEVAGEELAAHTRVRSVRDGECVVIADDPAWATRARYLGTTFRQHLTTRSGAPAVTSVTVVVGRPGGTDRDPPVR